jgi:hypothetical protein
MTAPESAHLSRASVTVAHICCVAMQPIIPTMIRMHAPVPLIECSSVVAKCRVTTHGVPSTFLPLTFMQLSQRCLGYHIHIIDGFD